MLSCAVMTACEGWGVRHYREVYYYIAFRKCVPLSPSFYSSLSSSLYSSRSFVHLKLHHFISPIPSFSCTTVRTALVSFKSMNRSPACQTTHESSWVVFAYSSITPQATQRASFHLTPSTLNPHLSHPILSLFFSSPPSLLPFLSLFFFFFSFFLTVLLILFTLHVMSNYSV